MLSTSALRHEMKLFLWCQAQVHRGMKCSLYVKHKCTEAWNDAHLMSSTTGALRHGMMFTWCHAQLVRWGMEWCSLHVKHNRWAGAWNDVRLMSCTIGALRHEMVVTWCQAQQVRRGMEWCSLDVRHNRCTETWTDAHRFFFFCETNVLRHGMMFTFFFLSFF